MSHRVWRLRHHRFPPFRCPHLRFAECYPVRLTIAGDGPGKDRRRRHHEKRKFLTPHLPKPCWWGLAKSASANSDSSVNQFGSSLRWIVGGFHSRGIPLPLFTSSILEINSTIVVSGVQRMAVMESKDDYEFKGEEQDLGLPAASSNNEFNLARGHNQLERGLKSRHIQFLALGIASLCICFDYDGQD